MTGRSTQPRKAQRGSGRCELPQTSCRSSPRAVNPTVYPDIPSRLQRQFHVTGTQYISTDKVQSQTLNTGGTAEDYFSPWANKPRAFFTIFYLSFITINYLHSQPSGYSHSASLLAQQNQRSAILPLYQPIHSSEIYLFGVHLQESCRS